MREKALIAMSGGVDSSVAAYLMKKAGYDVVGATMILHDEVPVEDVLEDRKCSSSDVDDAKAVADRLDIPFYVFDFTKEFKEEVIDRFVKAYEEGRTPNPCVDCNKYIKFQKFFEKGIDMEQDVIVTGHYARIEIGNDGKYRLKKGLDTGKDQSYVLYSMTQEELAHTRFPLGELTKEEVRVIAEKLNFVNADKKESQDICFVSDGDYVDFIEEYTGKKYMPGEFMDREGNVLGTHRGMIGYTIGQRKGLGLALKQPMYVVEKDMANNRVILGYNSDLMTTEFEAGDCNWISGVAPSGAIKAWARTRYNQKEAPATVEVIGKSRIRVVFDTPQRAITKGQSVVLYDGDFVLGGGIIDVT